MKNKATIVVATGIGVMLLAGCASSQYSGIFEVRSDFTKPIRIASWSNFGRAQPACGRIGIGGPALTNFPDIDAIPDSTTVTWTIDESGETRTQYIDMKNIVPRGRPGKTVFTLDKDGEWGVLFEPKK